MSKMTHIQVIGRASALKTGAVTSLTTIYKAFQQKGLFDGHVKTYKPRVEGTTEDLIPGEERVVQQDARAMLASVRGIQTALFDATLQQERGNTIAKADIVVRGETIMKDVPVTFLLWLYNQVNDLHAEIVKLPTLDPAERWEWDAQQMKYATAPAHTVRTKKIEEPLVLSAATKEHPAQVKTVVSDVIVGSVQTIRYSSAVQMDFKQDLLARVEDLKIAIKAARDAANSCPAVMPEKVGEPIFDWLFASAKKI